MIGLDDLPPAARDRAMLHMREHRTQRGLCPDCGHVHYDRPGGYACSDEACRCEARWFWVVKYGRTSDGSDFKQRRENSKE